MNRRLRKIICNNEVVHAITETGLVFSWGNDIYHRGTLGLGENIYQVNTPILNKYLSKHLIFDISLSEEHCTAIDFNNCMYSWGLGTNGELGFYNKNEKIVTVPCKVLCNNKPFLVEKIKCGKHYTTGITNGGIPFLLGNIGNKGAINDVDIGNNIIFFSLEKNYEYNNIKAKDIYCGDNYILILLEKEKLLFYNFNEGLFEIILNNNNKNITISKINVIDKNFYVLDEKNKKLYEFIYNIKDFFLTEYEINRDIKLSIIEMPFFVKFMFFWIECSETQKKNFILQKKKLFEKNIDCFKYNRSNNGPYINEEFLFGKNKKKIELKKVQFENNFRKNRINIFSKGDFVKKNNNNEFNYSKEEVLNLPISKNYGNKNDAKDKIDKKSIYFNLNGKYNTINNENDFNKISIKKNSKKFISTDENKRKTSISIERNIKRNKRTISDYHQNDDYFETIENKSNINIIKNNNSFLIQNKLAFNKRNNQIKENKTNYRTINKEEENEFDNIIRNINNRKLMINHPIKLEDNILTNKKPFSKIVRTKSKTEMLIKELHETCFGKENKKQNENNKYIRTNINKEDKEEIKEENDLEEDIEINLDYAKKKELEIDLNKILELNKNKKIYENKIDKNEKLSKENEKDKLEEKNKEKNRLEEKNEKEMMKVEKELREKLENEYKEKYEKEKKDNIEKKKNLVITTEINNFIKGNDNKENISENIIKHNKNNIFKFIPERLKEENENDFFMKGINKINNNNFIISNEQRINIENTLNKKNNASNNNQDKNILINNEVNELNLNIEDIVSTRDILFENNNNSPNIDSLISPISPKIENESKTNSKNETNRDKNLTNQQSIISSDLSQKNNININQNEKEENSENTNNLNETENILELNNSKKIININLKEKSRIKKQINEIIEENQELESLEDTNKSKNKSKVKYPLKNNNEQNEKSLIQVQEISNSNMKHISTFDQNIISTIRKFEPKELDEITGSIRLFTNRSENIIISSLTHNNKLTTERINKNITNNNSLKQYNINQKENLFIENGKDTEKYDEIVIKDKKMNIDELEQSKLIPENYEDNKDDEKIEQNKIIKLKNKEELKYILNQINQKENNSSNNSFYFLLEDDTTQINNKENIQILKVKNNKITELNSGKNFELDNNINKFPIFNNKTKYIRNYDLMNKESIKSKNMDNINKNRRYQKIKSYSKNTRKTPKKKIGIIEQIKKEQYEKKQQIIYNTFNNRNKIILTNNCVSPYIHIRNIRNQNCSKNPENNMFHYDPTMIPININMNMNILHDENNNTKKGKITNNKNNEIVNYNIQKEKEKESFIILRKKYLDFLIKEYGNEDIQENKEKEKMDNTFLERLIKNEVPIENINLLKCSSDMKNFIRQSLENFKLQQIKEKVKINESNFLYLKTNNNEKMQLDYDEDIKDKSNILEPIELDKSNNYNLNFRKSFVESLSGIKNENISIK